MKDNLRMIKLMEKENFILKMGIYMRENFQKIKLRAKEF